MKFFLLILVVLVFSGQVYSTETPAVKYPPREDFDMLAFDEIIKSKINEFSNKLNSGKLKWSNYLSFSSLAMFWYNHPYTEESTRINKTWFKDISSLSEKTSKIKHNMELAEDSKDPKAKEIYDKNKVEYDKLLKVLKALIAKPPKFSDDEYKKILEQNRRYNERKPAGR